jgi:hypothetical protein
MCLLSVTYNCIDRHIAHFIVNTCLLRMNTGENTHVYVHMYQYFAFDDAD